MEMKPHGTNLKILVNVSFFVFIFYFHSLIISFFSFIQKKKKKKKRKEVFWYLKNTNLKNLAVYCSFDEDGTVSWGKTLGGSTSTGTCKQGYYSSNPTRLCVQNNDQANWDQPQNPCLRKIFFYLFIYLKV